MFFDKDRDLMFSTNNRYFKTAYSPDGSKIATIFNERKIVVWDATTGREITRIDGHGNHSVSGLIFSPNGRQLVSCAEYDSNIKIWDTTSGRLTRSINQAGMVEVSFNMDGSRMIGRYFGQNNNYGIKIWNTANGSEIRMIAGRFYSAIYSPDGRHILTVSQDSNNIRILDAGNGQTIRTINSNGEYFEKAIYSPNGRYIAANDWNEETDAETIRIYNAETGQEIRFIPISDYYCHVYSTDGRQLLVSNNNTVIKIFDPDTGRELRSFNNSGYAVAFSPDGKKILTVPATFELKIENKNYMASYAALLDATTGKVTGTIGYGPLNVGARAYADMQILRFLADTAAVNRHEAVLKFITDRGNATRAEIEKFYRDNIRALITAVVDEEFNKVSFRLNRDYATLIRHPQGRHYTLSYISNTNERQEIIAPNLDSLLSEMGRRKTDFTQTDINVVRTRPVLIPAVTLDDTALTQVKVFLVNFFSTPNAITYENVRVAGFLYIDLSRRDKSAALLYEAAYDSYLKSLNLLSPEIYEKFINDNAKAFLGW